MKLLSLAIYLLILFEFSGCGVFKKSSKVAFVDDFYIQKSSGGKNKVYVDITNDALRIHPTQKHAGLVVVDTIGICQLFPLELKNENILQSSFSKHSFDVDFLTIPVKFRPSQKDVPSQINGNFNGSAYFGYRTDIYSVDYNRSPLGISERSINHFGFSLGLFMGFGNAFISPTNTNNQLQQEYDGVIWNKGLAGIVALNNFTIGLAFGIDDLLDKNKKIWIYHQKPWIGLAFGLNLN